MHAFVKRYFQTIVLSGFFLLSINSIYGQNKHVISINYGIGRNTMLINGFEKREGYSNNGMYSIGLHYQHNLSETLALKTGLEYRKNNIMIAAGYNPDVPDISGSWDTDILTLPLFINYQPLKYIFIEGGPLVDLQFNIWNNQPTAAQTGIGFGLGVGGIYSYKNLVFTLSPFVNYHAIIQFEPTIKERLAETGVKFGFGYQF